jgi:hypothetical protein
MSYIIKNTSGLINTRITDVGRRRISEGNFNISYFQIGDSEVTYQNIPNYNITNNNILMPAFCSQNDTGTPNSNRQNIKYTYFVEGGDGSTYGIPYLDSKVDSVYNSAGLKGFFNTGNTTSWVVNNSSGYTINSNYWTDMTKLSGQTTITIDFDFCSSTSGVPEVNDFVVIYMDGIGTCNDVETVPILSYKIQSLTSGSTFYNLTLDRPVPNLTGKTTGGQFARVHIYPSGMTQLYDTVTPQSYWQIDTLNFESPCDVIDRENTLIWNMNIPWTENPAGLFTNTYEGYEKFGSISYNGTKEYLGYNENSGQTDTGEVYYLNSFDEKISLSPSDQKAIAIIHYTNQDIDFVYGEKFATIPFDPLNPNDNTGSARHFKLHIPTLMWHKSNTTTIGADFYIDPPSKPNICTPYYIKSNVDDDMNDPGIRYFQLWDNNLDSNLNLNRIGKVFPDQQIIVIDDEEIVAALSYKSNRNWTLPAPKVSLITPNACDSNDSSTGVLTGSNQTMWVTYRFSSDEFTNSLHCNYYQKILGPETGCTTTSQNVLVRFGNEFDFLTQGSLTGYSANKFQVICQKRTDNNRPDPTQWKIIDFTDKLSASTINNYLTQSGITGQTFVISDTNYNSAPTYDLSTYMSLTNVSNPNTLNFGDEYFFYGSLETDITATIYEMRYLVTLGRNQFTNTSNPTWTSGTTSYITEVALLNDQKELMVVSKLQSPEKRQGIQQFVVKLDW